MPKAQIRQGADRVSASPDALFITLSPMSCYAGCPSRYSRPGLPAQASLPVIPLYLPVPPVMIWCHSSFAAATCPCREYQRSRKSGHRRCRSTRKRRQCISCRLMPRSARRIALTSYRASSPPSCFGWSRPPQGWWPFQGRECRCSSTAENEVRHVGRGHLLFNRLCYDRPSRSPDWLKMKNPDAPAVTREAEQEWERAPSGNRFTAFGAPAWQLGT